MTRKCFRKIVSVFPKPIGKLYSKFENLIIYVFYGVLTTLVNYIAHFGLRFAFTDLTGVDTASLSAILKATENSGVSSSAATTFSWVVALIFAFFVNKFFVFEADDRSKSAYLKEFLSFAGGRLFSYLCELLIMFVCVDVCHLNELIIKLACGVVVMILNYFFSKFLVFRKKNNTNDK